MRQVTRAVAMATTTQHAFVPGAGYFYFGAPSLPAFAKPALMSLPQQLEDGSLHWLKPPAAGAPVAFTWRAQEGAWAPRANGKRLAFTATYLASLGWRYERAG